MVLAERDRILIERCMQRSDGAWDEFVGQYLPLITHVVSANLAAGQDALRDDLVADCLLAVVDSDFAVLRRFRGDSSLGTYLVVICRRVVYRCLAKAGKSHARLVAEPVDQADQPEAAQLEIDDVEEVQTLLKKMPAEQATAIRLFHLEHRSYTDIGQSLGIPENSVGPLLSRARTTMRSFRS